MKKFKPEVVLAYVQCREDQVQSVALSVAAYLRRHGVEIAETRMVWRNHMAIMAVHHRSLDGPYLDILVKRAERVAAVAHAQHTPLFAA